MPKMTGHCAEAERMLADAYDYAARVPSEEERADTTAAWATPHALLAIHDLLDERLPKPTTFTVEMRTCHSAAGAASPDRGRAGTQSDDGAVSVAEDDPHLGEALANAIRNIDEIDRLHAELSAAESMVVAWKGIAAQRGATKDTFIGRALRAEAKVATPAHDAAVAAKALREAQALIKARIEHMARYDTPSPYQQALSDAWSLIANHRREVEREGGDDA